MTSELGFSVVVAYERGRGIGKDGALPWGMALKGDLHHFRTLTTGASVVMGRKTYESIGRPLPQRENIVITRHGISTPEQVVCVDSLAAALMHARSVPYLIGGGEMYRQALEDDVVATVYATEIATQVDGCDTFFPKLHGFVEVSREPGAAPNDPYSYDFVTYKKDRP